MNTSSLQSYSMKAFKKTVNVKNEPVMAINISYPVFESSDYEKKEGAFASKINRFYSHTAEKYTKYITEKYPRKAAKIYESNGRIKLSFLMSCTVSYSCSDIISVFTDLSYFDGKKKKTVRFSQNWHLSKSAILPASFCLDTSRRSRKYITDIISDIAAENMKNRNFAYFSDCDSVIKRKFSFDNFYFVPKGTAFFYNAGVLSDDDSPCVFVIPNEKIDGVLKISSL